MPSLARSRWTAPLVFSLTASCGDSSSPGEPQVLVPDASPSQDGGSDAAAQPDTLADDASPDVATDGPAADSGSAQEIANTCLNHTPDEPHCKDCCDCAALACDQLAPCRDACKTHDFSTNTDFIDVDVPSNLGQAGDYSACVSANPDEKTCKTCCECMAGLVCGDFQYCRTLCDIAYKSDAGEQLGAPQLVKSGFQFTEGPVWSVQKNALVFSDIDANTIYQLALPDVVTTLITPSFNANGLALDADGLLISAEHGSRSVMRTLADGTREVVASEYQGKKLNSPNDVVVRSDGTIYFSDPTFGLGSTPSELGFMGVYRMSPQKVMTLELQSDQSPNGVALSPDEKTLYVALTFADTIMAYDVAPDGATSNPRTFATVEEPDGMCVGASGRLYVAAKNQGAGALQALDEAGAEIATFAIPEGPTNCAIGDGAQTLFITARTALYRLPAPAGGF